MSVQRRLALVQPAMERLGYSHDDAKLIALDAPLSARMYDDEAIRSALVYAEQADQQYQEEEAARQAGQKYQPSSVQAAAVPNGYPMPANARTALKLARMQQRPLATRGGILGKKASAKWDAISSFTKPLADRLANVPVPTGLGGLFMLNLLFLFAIVPANSQGFTRLQLLWLTLMNRTKLPEQVTPQVIPNDPLVQGLMGIGKGVEDAATGIVALAGALGAPIQGAIGAIEAGGKAAQQGNPALPVYNPFTGPGNPQPPGNIKLPPSVLPPASGPAGGLGGGPMPPPTRLGRTPPPPPGR